MGMIIIGIAGLSLVLAGWVPEMVRTIRERRSSLAPSFALLYTAGSLTLSAYSLLLNEPVFLALNLAASLMSGISLYFALEGRR